MLLLLPVFPSSDLKHEGTFKNKVIVSGKFFFIYINNIWVNRKWCRI